MLSTRLDPVRRITRTLRLLVLTAVPGLPLAVAHAQTPTIYVASTGSDTSTGAVNAPKRTFQAAHDALPADGEIIALDTAEYGQLTISKGITVVAAPGVIALITVPRPPGGGFVDDQGIDVEAGPADVVTLRGLTVQGYSFDLTQAFAVGVRSQTVGVLRIENCEVRNIGVGMLLQSTANNAQYTVRGCTIHHVQDAVTLETAGDNLTGDFVVTDTAMDDVLDTAVTCYGPFPHVAVNVTLRHCTITHCGGVGVTANTLSNVFVDHCLVASCNYGVLDSNFYSLYGTATSSGNNTFSANAMDGSSFNVLKPLR